VNFEISEKKLASFVNPRRQISVLQFVQHKVQALCLTAPQDSR
jgi:hypothetical protein